MRTLRFYTKITLVLLFGVIILGYGVYRTKDLVQGPLLSIEYPKHGAHLTEAGLVLKGKAWHSHEVKVNDRPIFIDESGDFEEQLLLFYGYNTITIQAKDKFGRKVSETLEVVYN